MKIFHGVHHTEVNRVSFEAEGAGYRIPAGVKLELQAEDVEALLLKGDLDAIILPNIAKIVSRRRCRSLKEKSRG